MIVRSRAVAIAFAMLALALFGCAEPAITATQPLPTATIASTAAPSATATNTPAAPSVAPTATATSTPTAPPAPSATATATAVAADDTLAREETLRQARDADRPVRDLADLAVRLAGLPPAAATPVASANPLDFQAGRKDAFFVSDQRAKTYFTITATLAYVTPHAYFYVQDGERISASSIRQAADAFESQTYPLVRRYFGSERPGPNGDPRITILNARVPNVGGYFSSDDQYPRAVTSHSNERNILYINIGSYTIGTREYNATVAHELQHLVAWTVYRAADTWFNEGSSEFAMQLAGYDPGGAVTAYANNTDTQLTAWSQDDARTIAHYGAGYLFLNYFAEHYGGYEMLPDLFAANGRGSAPFDKYLKQKGYTTTFDDVFRDWVVANYLDDPSAAGGRYNYSDVDIRARAETVASYPLRRDQAIAQYSAKYYELAPGPSEVTIAITGTTTSRLLDNDPASGRFQWWSNRGDLMNTALTRTFDLSGLTKATLRFSAWYDLEDGFDYAYVEAWTDGGRIWSMLPGRHTTRDNPVGQNLGVGYTGRSGGANRSRWVQEEIDLSAYAGKKIMLRFEHVTDDAYNAPGFAVDDIAIPELGFLDSAESGDNGWQAIGFVRTANVIPQPYSVQLIGVGQSTTVTTIPVGSDGRATFTTQGLGATLRRAVLVVAPMAAVTTEPAGVQISVAPAR